MTVHFTPWNSSNNLLQEASRLYEAAGTFDCIQKGDLVAIKIHTGELGNPYYVQPFFVNDLARKVREHGGKPFLTDSNTLYFAQRHNALDHTETALMNGFCGAPFIVADGLKGENYRTVKTNGILSEIEVSGAIAEADAMIVVSHCKGHEISGFGGAIKNLGMGCTPPEGKLRQHRVVGIEIDQTKCTGLRNMQNHLPPAPAPNLRRQAHNTSPLCMRCPCACPNRPHGSHLLDPQRMTSSAPILSPALGVISPSIHKQNQLHQLRQRHHPICDCLPNPGEIVMPTSASLQPTHLCP
jgi:uncharacterized Fe-S center protein